MTKQQSFFIKDINIPEPEKVLIRQRLVSELTGILPNEFTDLFSTSFPVAVVGSKNCENLIGSVEVPVGVAGPVEAVVTYISTDLSKQTSKQSFLIPLATTEGALVASIHRGLKLLSLGETKAVIKKVGMSRSVVLECDSIAVVQKFIDFFETNKQKFIKHCEETSNHLKFLSYEYFTRGKLLFYRFVFDTDEAMGMNMVTIALSQAWEVFEKTIPKDIPVTMITLSGNVCTDKKDSVVNRLFGRGYFVTIESKISREFVLKHLKTTPEDLVKIHTVKNLIGSNVAGSLSQNMHVANALAAFYLATSQDIAHTVAGSEASVHFEVVNSKNKTKDLYISITLPNVSVGSIGGGTWLPAQKQARSLILLKNNTAAKELACSAGLACLAGELSGLAALTTNTLASSHKRLGR